MASYIQGVTDYIPHLQPFQPDLNFYAKALETKEGQYRSGYDKISNLYGTLLNSELLREPDREKRDKFFKQIENDIQRLSTADLSLQESVDSAYKVFQPLIDDRNIIQDMVWTKMYRKEKARAQGFRNCTDEKTCGGKWWEGGDRALDYQAEDFSNSDDATALTFDKPKFTPYVNTIETAMKLAKDMGIEVQSVTHSKSGYIVTTTNGQQITGPLRNYFVSAMMSDPRAIEMYRTQAYLNRKDYIASNIEKFGSEEAAENAYLQEKIALINKSQEHPKKETDSNLNFLSAQQQAFIGKLDKEGVPKSEGKSVKSAWDNMISQIGANKAAKDHYDKTTDLIKPDEIKGMDKRSLRYRVDSAMANALLTFDMASAAQEYADLHRKVSEVADPFALIDYKQKYERENRQASFEEKAALLTLAQKLKEGTTRGGLTWEPVEPGPAGTAKTDLFQQTFQDVSGAQRTVQDMSMEYAKKLYDYYYSKVRFGDAAEQTLGKAVLQNVFGGKNKDEGYLNPDFTLKYQDFTQNKNVHNIESFDSWDKVYKRALEVVKSQSSLKLIDPQSLSEFNEQEHSIQFKQDVRDAVTNTYKKNRKIVYDYIKTQGSGKFHADADLVESSSTRQEFEEKFYNRHIGDEDYIVGNKSITKDAASAYDEIIKAFPDIYNSNLAGGMSSTRPSISSGGGALGTGAMTALVDGSVSGEEGYVTMHSIKQDLDNPSTVVKFGENAPVGPDEPSPLASGSDPSARQVLDFFLGEYMKGNWKSTSDKRPVAQVTFSPIGANNKDIQAITFKFNETWAKKNRGTDKKPSSTDLLFDGGQFNSSVTLYVPTATAKNIMNTRSQYTDEDILLQNQGKIVLNQFKDAGGEIEIQRDKGGLKASGKLAYVDDNGAIKYTPFPATYSSTTNVKEFKNRLSEILKAANQKNLEMRLEILDSQEKYFSIDELEQLLSGGQ